MTSSVDLVASVAPSVRMFVRKLDPQFLRYMKQSVYYYADAMVETRHAMGWHLIS